ncbi:(2Fe-2S)-binding protein [Methylobacterium radiotolerans]|nr:(2Fe-2S)-binding protein [Methylobacterium radiotolerans]UIY44794.1 (2Fe-2S)-binding protein [Methylobacterium radiotolerans]
MRDRAPGPLGQCRGDPRLRRPGTRRRARGPLGDGEGDGAACASACTDACDDVAACLGWRAGPGCARSPLESPLAQALCPGASGCRRRRVCCLRHRLPGVPSCGALCPVECAAQR